MKAGTLSTEKLREKILLIADRLGEEDRELVCEYVRIMDNSQLAYQQTLSVLEASRCPHPSSCVMRTLESER